MKIRVAINGFGRIGRMVFKAGLSDPDIDFVAVNDLTDSKNLAYLFKYDSAQGRFPGTVDAKGHDLLINGKLLRVFAEKDPEKLPWKKHDIDVVVESTGFFRTRELASKHLKAGAKKVLISAPCKCTEGEEPVKTIVMGCNEHEYKGEDIVSNASCTTNCLAPMAKALNDNFGIIKGFMTTIHSYTVSQKLVDGPAKKFTRGRAAAANIVPTTSGATEAVGLVVPEVQGKIDGMAIRVPTISGSVTDFVVLLEQDATVEQINELFKNVANYHMKGILEYTEDPIVSSDVIGNTHSCVFDANYTKVINGNMVKILGWYDNEYGYSNRMIDMVKLLAKK
jgi:glyceraldehyde 3-phosphate dehydrogenase